MAMFATTEAAVARAGAPTAGVGYAAHLPSAANVMTGDDSADAPMLQRLQRTASASVRARQLKRQSEMIASSPAALSLQRFRQMANNSPQALQLKQQAENMTAASGETGPPQFHSDRQHWRRISPAATDAAEVAEAPGAVLQAVWEPEAEQEGLYRWDTVIDGKQWYYNVRTNTYRYVVVNAAALTFAGLNDAFDVDDEAIEDRASMTGRVQAQANHELGWGAYHSDADAALRRFDPRAFMRPLADPVSMLCLDYCLLDKEGALEKAISAETGNDAAKIHGGVSSLAFSGAFQAQLASTHFKHDGIYFGFGMDLYSVDHDEYRVSPSEAAKLTLRQALRRALWASMGHEIGDLDSKGNLQSADTVLDLGGQAKVSNMDVRFTWRVLPPRREACIALILKFQQVIGDLDAERSEAAVLHEMAPTFRKALDEKDKGIGRKNPDERNQSVAEGIVSSETLPPDKLRAYCVATVRRWQALLKSRVLVVFDAAGFSEVSGKTPTLPEATPANMMSGPAEEGAGSRASPTAPMS